jgi:hypothetical protein
MADLARESGYACVTGMALDRPQPCRDSAGRDPKGARPLRMHQEFCGGCLRARHSPFLIDRTVRDRWTRLMNRALAEAALPEDAEQVLRKFFDGMSSFMINQVER